MIYLARATDLARRMVTEFGMSDVLGPVRLASDIQANFLTQQYGPDPRVSPETATLVDVETRRILEEAVEEASCILKSHRLALESLSDLLYENETVDGTQIDALLGQKKNQANGMHNLKPARNTYKPFMVVASTKDDKRPKSEVEWEGVLRWENEGGQPEQSQLSNGKLL